MHACLTWAWAFWAYVILIFASFIHLEPLAEEAVYAEPEPVIQEPDEEIVVQHPHEEQQWYEELQPGHDYAQEATSELTSDPIEQNRHLKYFFYANRVSQ